MLRDNRESINQQLEEQEIQSYILVLVYLYAILHYALQFLVYSVYTKQTQRYREQV